MMEDYIRDTGRADPVRAPSHDIVIHKQAFASGADQKESINEEAMIRPESRGQQLPATWRRALWASLGGAVHEEGRATRSNTRMSLSPGEL